MTRDCEGLSGLDEVLRRLVTIKGTEITEIGELPEITLSFWPQLSTRTVVITAERREHYRLGRHMYLDSPEALEEFEREVVLTVREPDEIHKNATQPHTVILWRLLPTGRYMRVVVALATEENLSNSVITAWRPNARKHERARALGRLLWERV